MSSIKSEKIICAVHTQSTKVCSGEVTEVVLLSASTNEYDTYPRSLNLCQYHHQLELMVWGIKKFFDIYNLLSTGREATSENRWKEALEPIPDDSRLYFSLPEDLEFHLNRLADESSTGLFHPRSGFEYLKEVSIDLGEIRLTDKQLMAVCMVFYGGVKKKRAAQAMNITSQALSDHIKAALKKIGNTLANT
jgi:predicted DNA-binding protein (UPF0251 family)